MCKSFYYNQLHDEYDRVHLRQVTFISKMSMALGAEVTTRSLGFTEQWPEVILRIKSGLLVNSDIY